MRNLIGCAAVCAAVLASAYAAHARQVDAGREEPVAAEPAPAPAKASDARFPAEWFGRWRGPAQLLGAEGPPTRFIMELRVAPTDNPGVFRWTMVYDGEAGRQERPYTLLAKDAVTGRYAIDENNGIVLDARLIGDSLHSHFEVGGMRIVATYRLEDPGADDAQLVIEMATTVDAQANTTGGKDGVPGVRSWMTQSVQRAVLVRADDAPAPADAAPPSPDPAEAQPQWRKLTTEAYPGKQDDVFFVSGSVGWYANGAGKIFKTIDGGETWTLQLHKPGTFFRCLAFVDEHVGFAGNIGPGYFPNVSDATPLYQTRDGGETWQAVTDIEGEPVAGLCALEVVREKFINAGTLDERVRIIGVGRVGGPAMMIWSDDLGATWTQRTLPAPAAMALDVHFFDWSNGVLASASSADVQASNALILRTTDGGATWTRAYQSDRPFELTWKISFPTRSTGYVTIQSYDPDPAASKRFVARTTDGGATWTELPLVDDPRVRAFGVAFVDEQRGWIGAVPHGFFTRDGGATWSPASMGNAVNKIRVLRDNGRTILHAIGVELHRLEL